MATSGLTVPAISSIHTHEPQSAAGPREGAEPTQPPRDQVVLSLEAQNRQQLRHIAAKLVERLHSDLPLAEQLSLTAALEQAARLRYGDHLAQELLPAHLIESWVRSADGER